MTTTAAADTAPLTTMASAMFFGSILFATVVLAVRAITSGDIRVLQAALNPKSSALDVRSYASAYALLHHLSIFGLILFYAYICEYHPPYPHSPKSYDRDQFFFLTALLFLASFFTLKKHIPTDQDVPNERVNAVVDQKSIWEPRSVAPVNDKTEILNRDQTEEWKGWMQFMFLLYHYYHAEETYNAIRVMITCYVWMTGFGNFSFFYLKGDYSSVRVLQMLWRLNFLVVFLCLTQGTTYILYYICLLHTYYFLMVYVVMRVAKHVNYTKYGIRIKLTVLTVIIFLVWDVHTPFFRWLHAPFLGQQPMLGATSGAMWEWYFRSSLDHWSTFLGMTFALNFPITSLLYRRLEAQPLIKHATAKAAMALVFAAATAWWVTGPFQHGKYEYNATNAYFAWIPLYSYIYFRNLTPWLRNHTLDLLHQIGKTTLETYLMQHHIWLTSNAKSLLTLIPGWPMMNFLVVSIIYVVLSRRLYQLTLFLRGMVLPNDRNSCIKNLVGLVGSIGAFLGLAAVLQLVGQLNLTSVAVFSVIGGASLYRLVLILSLSQTESTDSADCCPSSSAKKFRAPLAGALAVLVVGIVWHHMARTGASKIIPLPATCQPFVQSGGWIPVEACNEASRGVVYRDFDISAFGTCAPQSAVYVWGWQSTAPSSHCRFAQRDAMSLLKTLNHRRVVFVGDSVIRHLYQASCRQLGDSGAGAYNTTLQKWSDFSRQYKNTAMDFKWAPFTEVLIESVDNMTKTGEDIDFLVIGGGAWDRLHRYQTESDRQNLKTEVGTLAKSLRAVCSRGVPVVWVVPTTINTWGLLTEEKRANIREDQMAVIRDLYKEAGVHEGVSFVLDGQSFTADRVADSYDGVHYPLSVYDAGAQILANALDWLLVGPMKTDPFEAPQPGKMANVFLGVFILCVVFVSIYLFDGFLGASYLAGLFVPSVRPTHMYEDAFGALHSRAGLPPITPIAAPKHEPSMNKEASANGNGFQMNTLKSKSSERAEDDDLEPLIRTFSSRSKDETALTV